MKETNELDEYLKVNKLKKKNIAFYVYKKTYLKNQLQRKVKE